MKTRSELHRRAAELCDALEHIDAFLAAFPEADFKQASPAILGAILDMGQAMEAEAELLLPPLRAPRSPLRARRTPDSCLPA